ncbi:MAG: FeoB-associated Cys-rich membrane protein [Anaerotignum sp.]|nr:FeoB-associated Cys-rich membrane protein [Anaerotignum sp.]MBQ3568543.1 FeoB-associated Cys-rich membrane protein [Anaerotignum sp.]
MTDIIVGLVVLAMVGAALGYIRKQKKSGAVCIGCPHAGTCGKKNCGCHAE